MRSLGGEIQSIDTALFEMKEVVTRNKPRAVKLPITTVENSDPDEMVLITGQWVSLEVFRGMRAMLTHEDEPTGTRYVLCETTGPVDCGCHKHDGQVEEIVMMEGAMDDLCSNQRITPGIRYKVPAGEAHWPVFHGPALFMVIFRRVGGRPLGDDLRTEI